MRITMSRAAVLLLVALAALSASADPCFVQFGAHGKFVDDGGCLLFEDDLGQRYEVLDPLPSWEPGRPGTLWAEFAAAPACSARTPLDVCRFDADPTKKITGRLVNRDLIPCPGKHIIGNTGNKSYQIVNCIETPLCRETGWRVQAEVIEHPPCSDGVVPVTVLSYKRLK